MEPARGSSDRENALGLDGLDFIEFATADAAALDRLFLQLGFQRIGRHKRRRVTLYRQNQINFVVNDQPGSFAAKYARLHGPTICALAFRVKSAPRAFDAAVARGARPVGGGAAAHGFPGVFGVGDAAVYFVDRYRAPVHFDDDFRYLQPDLYPRGRGLTTIDHITQAVPRGALGAAAEFYARVFGFSEVRGFDVRGARTGLVAKVLRSPCRRITVQLLEPTEARSQVQEYLDQHRGAGVRHLALAAPDLGPAVRGLRASGLDFLKAADDVHFTRPVIGPMFVEVVARASATDAVTTAPGVFNAIERDQIARGYL